MKMTIRSWRWTRSLCAAPLAASLIFTSAAVAQQPLGIVEFAKPVADQPAEADADSAPRVASALKPKAMPLIETPTLADPDDITPIDGDDPSPTPARIQTAPGAATAIADEDKKDGKGADAGEVELIKERFANGKIRLEREMALDSEGSYVAHGAFREFDEQGRLILEGRYVRNEKDGLWRRFYRGEEASLFKTSPYKNFTAPFISQATFSAGHLNGKWIITDARQRKVHELEFLDGERHGKTIWYYTNGAVMLQASYEHGRVNGDVIKFGPDSSIVDKENYQNGRKLAPKVETYSPDRKKLETTILHAALVVKAPDNWDTANLAIFEARGQDEKHGPFTAWHANGLLAKEGEHRFNLPVGKIVYWFPNGQKQMEGMYVDGKQEGVWTWWHANGLKSIHGEYRDGTPVGQWSWWKDTGKLAQKADLSAEKVVGRPGSQGVPNPAEAKLQLVEPSLDLR